MKAKSGNSAIKNVKANTDWAALKAMPDGKILFTEDAPQTSVADWANAISHVGLPFPSKKEQIALRVDAEVLQWFRAKGAGWQTRMNAVLKAYTQALRS